MAIKDFIAKKEKGDSSMPPRKESDTSGVTSDIKDEIAKAVAEAVGSAVKELTKKQKEMFEQFTNSLSPLSESLKEFNSLVKEVVETDREGGEDYDEYEADEYDEDEGDEGYYDESAFDELDDATKTVLASLYDSFNSKFKKYRELTESKMKELEKELERERAEKEKMRLKTIEAKKRNELASLLSDIGVTSVEGGIKWFIDRVDYDPETDTVLYVKEDGEKVPLKDALPKEVPEWLLPSRLGTGSGTVRGGEGRTRGEPSPHDVLKELEKQVEAAKMKAQETQSDMDIATYQSLVSKYEKYKREAGNSQG